MTGSADRQHLDRIRSRFTHTAQEFARFALATRGDEAERLAGLAAPRDDELALDLACGPGTFTRAFAKRVRYVFGFDLTAAMLEQARAATAQAGLANIGFACGDANALPFADATLGVAVCGYCFHHFLEPARVARELCRVLRRGGRVAVADIIVPEGADPEWNNRIERTRDPSHSRTLTAAEVHALLESAGLRVLVGETGERLRRFDDWMQTVCGPAGTPVYAETRRLMEAAMPGDLSGFHARFAPTPPGEAGVPHGPIEFTQTSLLVVAEKR